MSNLSLRGQRLLDSPPMPAYIDEHFKRAGAAWDSARHPDAYINLCIAENKLNSAALALQLACYPVPPRVLGYDAMAGNLEFRQRLARFMGRHIFGRSFEPEQIAVVAGAGAVLEMLGYAICDPNDGVLIPTPSYAGFWFDLETRDDLKIVTVDCSSANDFHLTTADLDAAFESADIPIKALLFTTPSNPLGRVYTQAQLLEVVEWATSRGVHLIVDEIYALSVFGETEFTSVASLGRSLGEYVHIVWAFSKDFGASGLRCGVLVSENVGVMNAVGSMAYWAACSGHTQHLLSELVGDDPAVDEYIAGMRKGLGLAYAGVTAALDRFGIAHVTAEAAFFLICDLRAHLEAPTFAAEHKLWKRLLEEANVNMTPGEACRINEPGFFRLCYAAETPAAVAEAINRIARVLGL